MSKFIHLGTVKVPIENYATQANAILGIKGSGKTTSAKVIAEQLLDAEVPIVVLDPIGMWRYLKVPREKGGKAYKVVVAGGQAGDLPLTPHTAPEILRSAMRSNIPLIIDLYDIKLSKADWRRIVKSSCEILLFENKGIRHVFLEEAAEYVPQVVRDGEVYAAVEKLGRMGGNASVGITLINPRAQEVNKAVLELCELLILQRQKGSHAMAAIDKWLTMAQNVKEVPKTIANLSAGEALVWPEASEPIRTQFPNCITFHPDRKKPDLPKGSIPENVAPFVDALRANLGNIEAELKANDPAELNRTIAELKRKLAQAEQKQPEVKQIAPVQILGDDDRHNLQLAISAINSLRETFHEAEQTIHKFELNSHGVRLNNVIQKILDSKSTAQAARPIAQPEAMRPHRAPVTTRQPSPASSNGQLDGPQQKILDTVAMLRVRGITSDIDTIAAWVDLHPNGGRFRANLRYLHENGYLENFDLTDHGESASRTIPTGLDAIAKVLDGGQSAVFEQLRDGTAFDIESLAESLGLHPNGGRFRGNVRRLRNMGVIPKGDPIKLTEAAYK